MSTEKNVAQEKGTGAGKAQEKKRSYFSTGKVLRRKAFDHEDGRPRYDYLLRVEGLDINNTQVKIGNILTLRSTKDYDFIGREVLAEYSFEQKDDYVFCNLFSLVI